jgi:hypothetical protein
MSDLRNQLRKAKQEYAAAKYPGDLAEDVLYAPRLLVLRRVVTAAMAVAAMLLLAWAIWPDHKTRQPTLVVEAPRVQEVGGEMTDEATTYSLTGFTVQDLTSASGTSLVPSYDSLTILQVPAMADVSRDDAATSSGLETEL